MNKQAIREVLTSLGVVLSLVFVAMEIRGNTEAVRGSTIQGIADQSIAVSLAAAEIPELRSAFRKSNAGQLEALTDDEIVAMGLLYNSVMRIAENRFRQIELGIITEPRLVGGANTVYRNPFFARFWEARRTEYPLDFVAYVDAFLLPLGEDSVPALDLTLR